MSELVFISRAGWGVSSATETFIRNRYSAAPREKTTIQVHHTAAIDTDDATPNRWDADEAAAYVRRLQHSRPDLGPLPYSVNLAVNEDLSKVFVFQARGILKVGAHTGGHNRDGVGFGILGNFDKPDTAAADVLVQAIEAICHDFRYGGAWADRLIEGGSLLPYLGNVKNPRGWLAWGHRDSSTKTCPGHSLYPLLEHFDHHKVEPIMPLNPLDAVIVDLAYILFGAHGDPNYWKGLDRDNPEFENLRKAIVAGATRVVKRGDSIKVA